MTDAAPQSSVSPDPAADPAAPDGVEGTDPAVAATGAAAGTGTAGDENAETADDAEIDDTDDTGTGTGDEDGGDADNGNDDGDDEEEDEDEDEDDEEFDLEDESDIAADYLEALLDIADLDGDIDMDVDGNRATVAVVGDDLDDLVGEDGRVLDALQELTRLAVQQQTGERSRLMLDVGGFRANRRKELTDLATDAIEEVKRTGESKRLEPMTPFERKCVHDVVAGAGLVSESEGEEPHRRVVVLPA